ncbi:hypothetical protein B0H17DRAFT_1046490 [Mycena rosella]|uniref:Uncharacterized protein n=1 Tax=Mycena rosella TaxID=1033263 RepID=A0AAD7DWD6_MYCRO|nr:hypothetical protein B0H17DRAFT_1046490 [Mycena rosella]
MSTLLILLSCLGWPLRWDSNLCVPLSSSQEVIPRSIFSVREFSLSEASKFIADRTLIEIPVFSLNSRATLRTMNKIVVSSVPEPVVSPLEQYITLTLNLRTHQRN